MRSARRLVAGFLVVLIMLAVAACAKQQAPATQPAGQTEQPASTTQPETQPPPAETPKVGGEISVGIPGEPKTMDPHLTTLTVYIETVGATVFETLVEADANGDPIPWLAESWEFPDETTMLIKLRQGVTFHNGAPFDAHAVKFTLDRVADPSLSSQFAPQVANVASVEVVDASTVKLNLKSPTPSILDNLLYVRMVSPQGIDNIAQQPYGTGPFRFVEWIPGDRILVAKNPNYWRQGEPILDKVVFRLISDAETRVTNLEGGAIDLLVGLDAKDAARVQGNSGLKIIQTPAASSYHNVQINTQKPPLDNAKLRLAIAHAIDREGYVTNVLYGFGAPAFLPYSSISWAYEPDLNEAVRFDLDKAAQLLAEANYPNGKGLPTLTLVSPAGWPQLEQGAVMLQNNLAKLGVKVDVRVQEIPLWIDTIAVNPTYDLTMDAYSYGGAGDPAVVFNTDNLNPDTNISRYKDPVYADLIAKAGSVMDRAQREAYYRQAQEVLAREVPQFLIAHTALLYAAKAEIQGFDPGPLVRPRYNKVSKG